MNGYNFDFSWVLDRLPLFGQGLLITLQILAWAAVISIVIGMLAGIGLSSKRLWVRAPVRAYVDLFRLTPLLVQIIAIFFLLPVTGISVSAL